MIFILNLVIELISYIVQKPLLLPLSVTTRTIIIIIIVAASVVVKNGNLLEVHK